MDISKIVEGIRNHVFPPKEIEDVIKKVSKERIAICIDCPFNSTVGKIKSWSRCQACGCFLRLKTKSLSSNCGIEKYNEDHPESPLPLKWFAVANEEEEHQINLYLKENDST